MKKLFLLIAVFTFTASTAFSQQDGCNSNSIFSQALLNPPSAYTSDENGNTQLDNFYGLTDEIYSMSFWGIMWDGSTDCYTPGPQDFVINFYSNVGDPVNGSVGSLVETFDVTITPTATGMTYSNAYTGVTAQILKYQISFPSTVSLAEGWFSVVKKNPGSDACMFNFLNTTNGDGHSAYKLHNSPDYHYPTNNRAFCLCKAPPVPVSNWALAVGILLILGFILIRYRTKMA